MKEIILIKLGELVLKGLNRRTFEDTLLKNLRHHLEPLGKFDIRSRQSAVTVMPREEVDMDEAMDRVGHVFGIATYVRAGVAPKNMDKIELAAADYLRRELLAAHTFKVEAKRSDKKFPIKSPQICAELGGCLLEHFPNLKVDVHHPDVTVYVEVRDFGAYIHSNPKRGAGGIPVGTGGKAALLISGGIDSPVAAWRMARRGVELTAVHFASPPYTSERAEQKVVDLLTQVSSYAGRIPMYTVPFAHVQEEIRDKCPEDLFTLLMRRFMMRVSQQIAVQNDCLTLITGESLGQVASQTMQAICCTDACVSMPVFRPLIGSDKTEIVDTARKIGTFDISIEPYEDCCTVFTPKHPCTKPHEDKLERAEQLLDVEALVQECIQNASLRVVQPR
ncbi:tRNA uracil 4-sulfurtransferase ThiI [Caproicibacterium lactatifermentans]|jgi:thiamine biosynthesis protein ThiI|uniref:Probable tRNA sulfurtransferase n=1 Tax=Caproicibacterium lactatifermentans TaxID=2666138 RepID=A0A859DNX9_9FIRM|nr:tRNA uracil 4-sulfurtransferase ThiI [Caproicibacterium lactatifermentans]QKN23249.1 tRNA 4-thiouridine(8) synthase ThiI [Caproicibacterium lactatifermentans]